MKIDSAYYWKVVTIFYFFATILIVVMRHVRFCGLIYIKFA